jgi:hypothetical protein
VSHGPRSFRRDRVTACSGDKLDGGADPSYNTATEPFVDETGSEETRKSVADIARRC